MCVGHKDVIACLDVLQIMAFAEVDSVLGIDVDFLAATFK